MSIYFYVKKCFQLYTMCLCYSLIAYSLWAVSYYCFPLLFYLSIFILLECSSKNCVLCSNLARSIISVRRLKLCHRNIFVLKKMKGSRAILSDYSLFKGVLLFSSVRCLVWKPWNSSVSPFGPLHRPKWQIFLPCRILQR